MKNFKTRSSYIQEFLFEKQTFILKYVFFKFFCSHLYSFRIKGNFLNPKESIDYIKSTKKSIIRFGDGEMSLIFGKPIHYQGYEPKLQKDLLKIIKNYTNDAPYLICIPTHCLRMSNRELKHIKILTMWLPFKIFFKSYFPKNLIYGNAMTFRYLTQNKINIDWLFKNKNTILVANKKTIETANLKDSKNLHTITVKEKNAYSSLNEIIKKIYTILKEYEKKSIVILLSCGPLAKVLAYKISIDGYRVIDIGKYFIKPYIQKDLILKKYQRYYIERN